MTFEEYYLRYITTHKDKATSDNLISLIRMKVENLETANKHLKVEAEQK